MSNLLDEMRNDLLSLPVNDRARLAHDLIKSLDENIDSCVDNAWEAEICRRVQEIKDGTAKGKPAEEVLSEIRAKFQ
ncbi:MAG: addiction module protein [Candidatus Scalindua sp.]|nr:addiction module protein [Candidatus Scalindua sp.]